MFRKRQDYQAFIDDPLGIKQEQLEKQEKQSLLQRDPFNDKIKFIEDVDKAHSE